MRVKRFAALLLALTLALGMTVTAWAEDYACGFGTGSADQGGVTATGTFASSPVAGGSDAQVNITFTGTANAAGKYVVSISSSTASGWNASAAEQYVLKGDKPTDTNFPNLTMPGGAVTDVVVELVFTAASISGVTAGTPTVAAAGGDSLITVSGTNLPGGITVTAFDGAGAPTGITGTTTGDDATQTATLTFPANSAYTNATYTVKVSLDGGATWEVSPAPTVTQTAAAPLALSSVKVGSTTMSSLPSAGNFADSSDGKFQVHRANADVDYELYVVGAITSEIVFDFNGTVTSATASGGSGQTILGTGTATVTASNLNERDVITFKDAGNNTVKIRVMSVARVNVNLVGAITGEGVGFSVVSAQFPPKSGQANGTKTANYTDVFNYKGGNLGTATGDKITVTPSVSGARTATIALKKNGVTETYSAGYELMEAAVYTFTVTFRDPPVSYDDDDDSSSSGSSGGGGSSSGSNIPSTVTPAAAASAVNDAVQQAAASGSDTATARIFNPGDVSLDTLKSMQNPDVNVLLNADNLNPSGTGVEVRISLDPSQATKDLDLSASTSDSNARNTNEVFQSYFQNNTNTVSFGQQGDFGQSVRVAVKPDPDLNTDNLHFYAYDKETNTYTQLSNADYFVDANGYVHFTTSVGGSIIMSDGPLTKK